MTGERSPFAGLILGLPFSGMLWIVLLKIASVL
jgi:hypothetical protein